MMIDGLTDPKTLEATLSKPCIFAYKGSEQEMRTKPDGKGGTYDYPISGHDLETFFRLEVGDTRTKNFLLGQYKKDGRKQEEYARFIREIKCKGKIPLSQDSLFLSEINLYLPYDDLEKTFETYMGKYSRRGDSLSGLLSKCNKRHIYRKYEPVTTDSGHVKKQVVDCQETCPIAGTDNECPNGCKETGILTFYLRELFDVGNFDLCSLTVSGLTDISGIASFLHNDVRMNRGTISRAEHSVRKTQRMLPFIMSRRRKKFNRPLFDADGKRTGKSTQDVTYAAVMRIDPEFIVWERKYYNSQELLAIGVTPQNAVLEEVYETKLLAPLPGTVTVWKVTEKEINEIKKVYEEHSWDKTALSKLLRDQFQFQSFNQVYTLTKGGYDIIMQCLKSPSMQEKYGVKPVEVKEVEVEVVS